MEYALKYQKNLKGLIISNMMSAAEYKCLRKRRSGTANGPQNLKTIAGYRE
jgi:proline iminopeptidase